MFGSVTVWEVMVDISEVNDGILETFREKSQQYH